MKEVGNSSIDRKLRSVSVMTRTGLPGLLAYPWRARSYYSHEAFGLKVYTHDSEDSSKVVV